MEWVCPADHEPLQHAEKAFNCTRCGKVYRRHDGVPVFAETEDQVRLVQRSVPVLDELWALVDSHGSDEAARRFCKTHPCRRAPTHADWKFYVSAPEGGTVLELGGGFGDDAADLARRSYRPVSLVSNPTNALILRERLRDAGLADSGVAILSGLNRLPLADNSVQLIVMEDVAAPGFGLAPGMLPAAAREWRRVLSPDGTLFLGVSNPLYRGQILSSLKTMVQASIQPDSLERYVKRAASGERTSKLTLKHTIRELERAGFNPPAVQAPLPDERKTRIVLPVEDKNVVRYFLNNLVRRNSPSTSAAIRLANGLNRLGLFKRFVPYWYLLFESGRTHVAG